VISGVGRAFSAGVDLDELAEEDEALSCERVRLRQSALEVVARCSVPTVAAIGGFALGGGLELALACDFRIADEAATFSFPEIERSLMPGGGGTQRLPWLIGHGRALSLLLSAATLSAQDALRIGLIDGIAKDPNASARDMISAWSRFSPRAIAAITRAVRSAQGERVAALEVEAQELARLRWSS
jgi:enoyl-CoA hydratase